MRFESLFAALVVLSQIVGPAYAELQATPPHFRAKEARVIGRNELLRAIIEQDPWLVRRLLDVMEEGRTHRSDEVFAPTLEGIDRAKNPDIVSSERTAAGSVEWIELLRRARDAKATVKNSARSAQGSVEFLEMLRRANGAKNTAK